MNIALDIDGTITEAPGFFACLSHGIRAAGGKVLVVTSRANRAEVAIETRKELESYRVELDELYLIPDKDDEKIPCPHEGLDGYQQYLWQKVAICLDEKVRVVFEDDEKVIALFEKYAPGIQVFQVRS